jgi:SAM-dependent methyltransferase
MALQAARYDVAFLRRKEIILKMTKFSGSVLDIGCSTGAVCDELGREGLEAVGIDMSVPAVKLANIHVDDGLFLVCDGTELPFKEEHFEAVICADVLEHVENDWKMVQEISRVLEPGGIAVFTVPSIYRTGISDNDLKWADIWGHVRVGYTVGDMVALSRKGGLRIIETKFFSCHFALSRSLWYIVDKLVRKWIAGNGLQELLSIDRDVDIGMLESETVRKLSGKLPIKLYVCLFPILDALSKLGDAVFPKNMKDHLAVLAKKDE